MPDPTPLTVSPAVDAFMASADQNTMKANLGLGNVDNVADADKPISDATALALTGKADSSHTHPTSEITGLDAALTGKADTNHTHDDRYYTESETDALLTGKADSSHTHPTSEITDFHTEVANNSTVQANSAKVTNATHTGDAVGSTSLQVVRLRGVSLESTVASPSDGDILVYRTSGAGWTVETKPAGGSNPAINDITDVAISSAGDDELLSYNSATGEWINKTAAEAGLAAASHTHNASDVTDFDSQVAANATVAGKIADIVEDGSPQLGGDLNAGGFQIWNFKNRLVTESGTSVTLGSAHYGAVVVFTSASPVTVSVPETIPAGVTIGWVQAGAGALTFAGTGTMVINNVNAETASAGQYSQGSLFVVSATSTILSGETA